MSNRVNRWLEEIGLGEHVKSFVENDIHFDLLTRLSTEELKELGLSVGHRRRFLDAVAKLKETAREGAETSSPSVAHGEAERRQLTVMFCDLAGSTELSQKLDAEDLREVNRAYQDACKAAIERYEGYIARYMGDGVLAYFGYPQAHEDDAERAIHAGLGVVAGMADLTETMDHMQGEEVRVRVGIATGPVVVGDIVGEGASQENAVVGETPNLAARLQSMAVANSVWVDETTHRLAEGLFDWSALGELWLKGFQAQVPAFQAIREREVVSRYEARGVDHYRLVGRQSELALLNERWSLAVGGEGQVVDLSGEPGIGKSRLLQNFLEQIPREQYMRVQYQCSPYNASSSLFPVLRQIELAAGFGASDSGIQRLDKLERFLSLAETESRAGTALVGALLDLPVEDRYGPPDITPQQRKAKTLSVLSRHLVLGSETLPIVVIFEDIHWVDPTTEEYLQQVIGVVENTPILVLVTHRPEYQGGWSSQHGHCTSLSLNRLGRQHARDLADAVSDGNLPAELMEHVVARTDGIPLFIEELTSSLLESRELNSAIEDVPITLQASLDARLDRLGIAREVAQVGSILGRDFSYRLLAEVAGKSDDRLEDWCRRLVEAGLASQHGTHEDTTYTFKHALVQEAAYNTLLKPKRRELHAKAAKAIETLWPQMLESNPEVVAEHFARGGELKRATELWLVAGRLSAQRTAYKEAITHLTRVLDTAGKQSQTNEWLSHELSAWTVLGPVLMATEGPASPGSIRAYRKAREISAALKDGEQHFRATAGLWHLTNVRGQHSEAKTIAEELISASKADGDDNHTLQAHHASWSTTFSQGDFDTCGSHLANGLALYDEDIHREHKFIYQGHDPGVCCRLFSALTSTVVGQWDSARKRVDECLELAERLQHPFSTSTAHFGASMAMYLLGQTVEAERTARRGLELSTSYGLKAWMPFLDLIANSSSAQMMEDEELDGAVHSIEEAFRRWQGSGAGVFNCWFHWELGKLEERRENLDKAMQNLEAARQCAEVNDEGWLLAEILRACGRLERKIGSDADKERMLLEASQSTAIGQGAYCFGLRSTIDLARFFLFRGDRESGKDCLKQFCDRLPDGFDTSELKEANVLLQELS